MKRRSLLLAFVFVFAPGGLPGARAVDDSAKELDAEKPARAAANPTRVMRVMAGPRWNAGS